MKRCTTVCLFVLAVSLLLLWAVGCGGGSSDPEDTVRSAFKALEAKDAGKLVGYYVEDVRDEIEAKMVFAFSIVDRYRVANLETKVLSQNGDTAAVEAEYDRTIEMDGQKEQAHVRETYELAKVDGKWLLLGEATEVEEVEATPTPTATPPAGSSPEGTVLQYYRSIEARDIGAILKCFREDLRDDLRPGLEEYFSYMETVSIPALEVELAYKTDTEATVNARYEIYTTDDGETMGGPVQEDLYLEKIGGKWLIAEDMGLAD